MRLTFALLLVLGCGGNEADSEPEAEPVASSGAETETETAPETVDGYAADLELICNRALQESGFTDATPENKATVLARYIDENLQSEQGTNLFSGLAQLAPAERAQTMATEAQNNGISECAIVEIWAEPATEP